jgi:hypothetical protein
MLIRTIVAVLAFAGLAAGCQTIPKEQTVGQYCADAKHANKDVCKINVEINNTNVALKDTNMRLSEARAIADQALSTANAAMARQDQMFCETRTIRRTNVGKCSPGYTMTSCTQTRFTKRAGGLSIMREVNDSSCRFHDKVLEMQVRCCMAGAAAAPTEAALIDPKMQPKAVSPQPVS